MIAERDAEALCRYQQALKRIGHSRLLSLPDKEKEELKITTDLSKKAEILERIADRLYNEKTDNRSFYERLTEIDKDKERCIIRKGDTE